MTDYEKASLEHLIAINGTLTKIGETLNQNILFMTGCLALQTAMVAVILWRVW